MTDLGARSAKQVVKLMAFLLGLIFLPAGTFDYWQGWVVWTILLLSSLGMAWYFLKTNPQFVERRLKAGPRAEGEKSQKVIVALLSFLSFIIFAGSALEQRFLTPPLPLVAVLAGQLSMVFGFLFVFFVFRENRFAASTVTVEASQQVISTGVYGLVRHPMYFGAIFILIGTPLALGAVWSVLFGVAGQVLLAVRLLKEEQFLKTHLQGYGAYCDKVRYHLVPYVW